MASATTVSPAAVMKVTRMPATKDAGDAANTGFAAAPSANKLPITDAPVMSPKLRDKLSNPDITPRWSARIWVMIDVLLGAWKNA